MSPERRTAAINTAIQQMHERGGGRVIVRAGEHHVGGIRLLDGIDLHLAEGAALLGVDDDAVYPEGSWGRVVWALDAKEIALTGPGVIDGQAKALRLPDVPIPTEPYGRKAYIGLAYKSDAGRHPVLLHRCTQVRIEDVHLRNSKSWTLYLLACNDATVRRVRITNACHSRWTDGIDIESCDGVLVEDCVVTTGDDAVCVKSAKRGTRRPCRNVTVRRCTLRTECNALKVGNETEMDISNVLFEDCHVAAMPDGPGPEGGLTLTMAWGSTLSQVVARNITMADVRGPLFIKTNVDSRQKPGDERVGRIHDVLIENVRSVAGVEKRYQDIGSIVAGTPGGLVENVTLRSLDLTMFGGEQGPPTPVPDLRRVYTSAKAFGVLPAHGLYIDHARGVRLDNVTVRCKSPDLRPALLVGDHAQVEGDVS